MDEDDRTLAYLQGRLDGVALSAFEQDMTARPELRAEVAALRAVQAVMAQDDAADRAADPVWDRLSQSIAATQAPANLNRGPQMLKYAAVALGAIAAWQLLAVPNLRPQSDPGFTPASVEEAGFALRVGFTDQARLSEAIDLLAQLDAEISAGPSAIGLLTLTFASEAARTKAEAELQARSDLIAVVTRP